MTALEKNRHMDPLPLPSAETLKSARTSVAADLPAPTFGAHLFEATTTAVLDQPPGCYSYRSEHPFSRDCRSPTTGPAQERHHRERVSKRPGGVPRGALQGPPPMVGRDISFPVPLPFQYWNLPRSSLLSSKIPEPPCALSPGDAHPLWGPGSGSPCQAGAGGGWMPRW